jgi:hypothetical protein
LSEELKGAFIDICRTAFGKEKVAQRARTKELRLPDQAEILGRVVKHSGEDLLLSNVLGGDNSFV